MRTMIWKELRENALWALLALIASLLTVTLVMSEEFSHRFNINIWSEELAATFACLGSIAALLFGFLQTVPESSRDRWAFLMHRGISAGTVFRAKTLAALAMYVSVLGLPMLLAIVWSVSGGYREFPFEWRMVLSPILFSVAAFGFYFAAYHLVLRESGFPIGRLLPVLIPVGAILIAMLPAEIDHFLFWPPAIAIALLTIAAGIIAERTMAAHGVMQDFGSVPRRVLFATNFLTLAVGLGFALALLLSLIDGLVFDVMGLDRRTIEPERRAYTHLWVDADGVVLRSTLSYETAWRGDSRQPFRTGLVAIENLSDPNSHKYREFVGQRLTHDEWRERLVPIDTASVRLRSWSHVGQPSRQTFFQELDQLGSSRFNAISQARAGSSHPANATSRNLRHLSWQLSATHGVILGYEVPRINSQARNRRFWQPADLKYVIGPDGIGRYPDWPRERFGRCLAAATDFQRFPSADNWRELEKSPDLRPVYLFENGLFQFDLAANTVTTLFRPPIGQSIRNIDPLGDNLMAVFMDTEIHVCKAMPHSIGSTPGSPVRRVVRNPAADDSGIDAENPDAGESNEGTFPEGAQADEDAGFAIGFDETSPADEDLQVIVETPLDDVIIMLPGDVVKVITIPGDAQGRSRLSVAYHSENETAYFHCGADPRFGQEHVLALDSNNVQSRRFENPLDAELTRAEILINLSSALIIPLAPVMAIVGFEGSRHFLSGQSLIAELMHAAPTWLVLCGCVLVLSSVVWAMIGNRLAIRYGTENANRRRWALVGLLLGPAGLLALVTTHRLPGMMPCPVCKRRRVLTRMHCEHCDAGFPLPDVNGTEIFAAAAVETEAVPA